MDSDDLFCLDLARSHYENFPVVSRLAPAEIRLDLARIYAFARLADDLGDEVPDRAEAIRRLDEWEDQIYEMYAGRPSHPVLRALSRTVEARSIPPDLFLRLIAAFRRDQLQVRYETFDDLLSYCHDSANPVGRLVLHAIGLPDETRGRLADATCTALQLTNFWTDVPIDLRKGRIYIPLEDLERFGVDEAGLAAGRADLRWRALMSFEVRRTRDLFERGLPLLDLLPRRFRPMVGLFTAGGLRVLDRFERAGFDSFAARPTLGRGDAPRLAARALAWSVRPPAVGRTADDPLEAALDRCERILAERAGNFGPALRLLDDDRRRALAAVYAFARAADDAVDDGGSVAERWRSILDLRAAFDDAWSEAGPSADPVLAAVVATARRYALPRAPFDGLLAGCASDVERDRLATLDDLLGYCRDVAGTVGILTARVLGARDDARAEEMGIAFQLTNILRDVAEDARRGRIYLPLEDLASFGVRAEDLLAGRASPGFTSLVALTAARARERYDRAAPIVEAVVPSARPAMRALVGIYRALLERIAEAGPALLDRRLEVPRRTKARIVLGAALSSFARRA